MLEGPEHDERTTPRSRDLAAFFSFYWSQLGLAGISATIQPKDIPFASELAETVHAAAAAHAVACAIPPVYLAAHLNGKVLEAESATRELAAFDRRVIAGYAEELQTLEDAARDPDALGILGE